MENFLFYKKNSLHFFSRTFFIYLFISVSFSTQTLYLSFELIIYKVNVSIKTCNADNDISKHYEYNTLLRKFHWKLIEEKIICFYKIFFCDHSMHLNCFQQFIVVVAATMDFVDVDSLDLGHMLLDKCHNFELAVLAGSFDNYSLKWQQSLA